MRLVECCHRCIEVSVHVIDIAAQTLGGRVALEPFMRDLPLRECFMQLGRDATRAGQCVCCADDREAEQHAGDAPQWARGHGRRERDSQKSPTPAIPKRTVDA